MQLASQSVMVWMWLTVLAAPSTSQAQSTQEMLSFCRAVSASKTTSEGVALPRDFESGVCWGAFAAIQAVIVRARPGEQPFLLVCAPPKSTRLQLIAVFVRYSEDHPNRLHEDFMDVALDSLRQAFPCPRPR